MDSQMESPPSLTKRALDGEPGSSKSKRPTLRDSGNSPRFLILTSTSPDNQLSTKSPFFINKALQSMAGTPRSVRKLRSGDLLVEVSCPTHSNLLLQTVSLGGVPVKVTPHLSLNSSRGVISERELLSCSDEELQSELSDQGVTAVRRIRFKRDGVLVPSRSVILTFDRPRLPTEISAGYLKCEVRPYIPNPLRCFRCQVYGHSQLSCRGAAACARCGGPDHDASSCSASPNCVNCKGSHAAFSRDCPKWSEEKTIQRVKTTEGLSYPEARRKVVPSVSPKPTFAAVVKATVTTSTQTDLTVPPKDSFSEATRFMLSSASSSKATQSAVSAVTKRSPAAPVVPARVSPPVQRSVSRSPGRDPGEKPGPKSAKKKKHRSKGAERSHSSSASEMVCSDVSDATCS